MIESGHRDWFTDQPSNMRVFGLAPSVNAERTINYTPSIRQKDLISATGEEAPFINYKYARTTRWAGWNKINDDDKEWTINTTGAVHRKVTQGGVFQKSIEEGQDYSSPMVFSDQTLACNQISPKMKEIQDMRKSVIEQLTNGSETYDDNYEVNLPKSLINMDLPLIERIVDLEFIERLTEDFFNADDHHQQ